MPADSAFWSATANCRIRAPEKMLETYYSLAVLHLAHLSFDYQYIANPAYNRDRGPVSVLAVRVHAQF